MRDRRERPVARGGAHCRLCPRRRDSQGPSFARAGLRAEIRLRFSGERNTEGAPYRLAAVRASRPYPRQSEWPVLRAQDARTRLSVGLEREHRRVRAHTGLEGPTNDGPLPALRRRSVTAAAALRENQRSSSGVLRIFSRCSGCRVASVDDVYSSIGEGVPLARPIKSTSRSLCFSMSGAVSRSR